MKKQVSIGISISFFVFLMTACGPSEASKKAEAERLQIEADSTKNKINQDIASEMDSLKKDNKVSDSLVKVEQKK